MYQGRTVSASTRPTEHKKKNVTLKSLGVGSKSAIDMQGSFFQCLQIMIRGMELDCQDLYSSINSLKFVPVVFLFYVIFIFFPFLIVKVIQTISKNQEVVTNHLSSCKCWPPQVKHFCISHFESLQRIKDNLATSHLEAASILQLKSLIMFFSLCHASIYTSFSLLR